MNKNRIVKTLLIIMLIVSVQLPVIAATTGVVNVDTVRVREKATTDSDIVELVSIGDKINITGEEGDWYKVKVGKVTGYIRKDLLTVKGDVPTSTEPTNNEEKPEIPVEETPTEQVPNKEKPDTPAQETPNEEPTETTPTEKPSETTGENVVKENKKISTIKLTEGVSEGGKVTLDHEIEIKILPSANSSNIEKLQEGTEVTVLEIINKWCRVETAEGACGWVRID